MFPIFKIIFTIRRIIIFTLRCTIIFTFRQIFIFTLRCVFIFTLGGYPHQHNLIFCQFVESDPKGPGLKYLAGWMLFGRVIEISKIEKMRFSSYFDACDESSSYLASRRSYEVLEKKFFTKNCPLGPPLPGDILSFQKRIRFRKVRQTKMFLKWYLLDYKKWSLKVYFTFSL